MLTCVRYRVHKTIILICINTLNRTHKPQEVYKRSYASDSPQKNVLTNKTLDPLLDHMEIY